MLDLKRGKTNQTNFQIREPNPWFFIWINWEQIAKFKIGGKVVCFVRENSSNKWKAVRSMQDGADLL